MLITRESDYALRILSALSGGDRLTAGEICKQELAPQQFGYKILKKLAKGGLVEITRGSEGGCRLCCDLQTVTLYDLMEIMEEDRRVSLCMESSYICPRRQKNNNHCTIHRNLAIIQTNLDQELKAHSIAEILCTPEQPSESFKLEP
ncbi:MAG: Rrf2 family transcriptional regulator [Lachnospiraceae bacterium]|nr:Rrf2 family transcriptional regulator [Lachnospiraceae bacterium]